MLNFTESRGFQSELWTLLFQMNASFSSSFRCGCFYLLQTLRLLEWPKHSAISHATTVKESVKEVL